MSSELLDELELSELELESLFMFVTEITRPVGSSLWPKREWTPVFLPNTWERLLTWLKLN